MAENERYEPIENYGVIGDLHTVALVSLKGSVDFFCYPRFDCPSIFAALLDAEKGGRFSINPLLENMRYKQMYLPDTAILVSRFYSEDGISEITDFMPVNTTEFNCALIRRVTTIKGSIKYEMKCAPRFDYGRAEHHVTPEVDGVLFHAEDSRHSKIHLYSDIKIEIEGKDAAAKFTLGEKESVYFIFESTENQSQRLTSLKQYVQDSYQATIKFWETWVDKSNYQGRWIEMVNRSAITLKLLTSYRYGSVIAAATFGLPETVGGERNWDYRYAWIRDASFCMYTFLKLGFIDEATAFLNWIKKQCSGKDLQLIYGVDGGMELQEHPLDSFEGYMGSRPVRIGNQAHEQFQLDIYGELIDTIYLYNKHGGPITYEFWNEIERQVEFVVNNWEKPDHGIWEIRNDEREFLYSRLMCWVAMDRAMQIAEQRAFPYPADKWRTVRDKIFHSIYNDFWSDEVEAFVQSKGDTALDASALMMPLRNFISPYEEKWKKTMKAIEDRLQTGVLIYRYDNKLNNVDGLKGIEGSFSMCTFWYVKCLAKGGKLEAARENFEKMLGYANHLGLFAEEIGSRGEQLGNFPQAFTHMGLISAAYTLNKELEKRKNNQQFPLL